MFCPFCGAHLSDDAQFCGECGLDLSPTDYAPQDNYEYWNGGVDNSVLPLPDEEPPSPSNPTIGSQPTVPYTTVPMRFNAPRQNDRHPYTPPPVYYDNGQTAPLAVPMAPAPSPVKSRRNKLIAWAVVLGIALVLVIAGIIFVKTYGPYEVDFAVNAPGYDSNTDSKIPVQVSGTDFFGTKVDRTYYIKGDGSGLWLMRGTYTAKVAASPLLANANIYNVPSGSMGITIDAEGLQSAADQLKINFTVTDTLSITDSQITDAYDYAKSSGMSATRAQELKDAITKKRDDAKKQQAATESSGSSSSSNSSAGNSSSHSTGSSSTSSSRHYSCEYFEFDVPESWAGKFAVTRQDGTFYDNANHFAYSIKYTVTGPPGQTSNGRIQAKTLFYTLRKTSDGSQSVMDDIEDAKFGNTSTSPSYSVWLRWGLMATEDGPLTNSELNCIKNSTVLK